MVGITSDGNLVGGRWSNNSVSGKSNPRNDEMDRNSNKTPITAVEEELLEATCMHRSVQADLLAELEPWILHHAADVSRVFRVEGQQP